MMEGQEKGPVRIVGHCLYVHLPKNYVLNATLCVFLLPESKVYCFYYMFCILHIFSSNISEVFFC